MCQKVGFADYVLWFLWRPNCLCKTSASGHPQVQCKFWFCSPCRTSAICSCFVNTLQISSQIESIDDSECCNLSLSRVKGQTRVGPGD